MESIMDRISKQEPVIFFCFVPFTPVCQLIAHEIQFFARMCKHIEIQCTQLCKFLFICSPHLIYDRCLAVNNFIMTELHQEALRIKIRHRECNVVVMPFTVNRIFFQIFQSIIHPAQIPFIVKSKTAFKSTLGNIREIRGIFRNQHDFGAFLPQLARYRREKKSLFTNYKEA